MSLEMNSGRKVRFANFGGGGGGGILCWIRCMIHEKFSSGGGG